MAYVKPENVRAPKKSLKEVQVIYNTGPQRFSWSVARLLWNDRWSVGIRWNGNKRESSKGNPQSHAKATWFIVPSELEKVILRKAEQLENRKIAAGYRAKAREEKKESRMKKKAKPVT